MYDHNDDFEKASIELKTDISKVLLDVQRYASMTSWGPLNQICYTNTNLASNPNDVFEGSGSLAWVLDRQDDGSFIKKARLPRSRESHFTHFNDYYKDSYIHELYLEMQEVLKIGILRFRAMYMMPACSLTMHHDNEARAHVALKTDEDNFFVVNRKEIYHLPADNKVRVMDTRHTHTFVNASVDTRIHIVAGLDTYEKN